jgi:hypothetical protein
MTARQATPFVVTARSETNRHMDIGNTEKHSRHNYYTTDWTGVRTLMESRLSVPFQIGPEASPASCETGAGSLVWVERPVHVVNHPPPFSDEVKERVELYLCSASGYWWPAIGLTILLNRQKSTK